MDDAIYAFDRLFEAVGLSQIGDDKIRVEMSDVAVITRLSNHQSRAIATEGKLRGHFVADESRSACHQ